MFSGTKDKKEITITSTRICFILTTFVKFFFFTGGGGSDEYGVLLRSTFLFSPPTFEEDTDDNCFLLP